jgi:hypothetical protein
MPLAQIAGPYGRSAPKEPCQASGDLAIKVKSMVRSGAAAR